MPPKKKKMLLAYIHEQLLQALEDMKRGETASSVSRRYNIPRSTLIYTQSGKTPLDRRMGPAPLLGIGTEQMITNWVKAMAVRGFPVTKGDLLLSVQQIAKEMNLSNAFPNGKPGNKWLALFLQRHPDVSERTVEKLSKVRANVTEPFIKNWFAEVNSYLTENNVLDVLNDPSRVFNLDESAFFLCPKGEKVLGIKGQKNVYEVHGGSDKENLTVLINVNAGGQVAPTLVVFPGLRLPTGIKLNFPNDWTLSRSESGWINGEVFYLYFVNCFFKWLKDQNVTFPIVVFLDGHKSHLTYHLSDFCSKNEIILVSLPPNCTHILQPLDVALFRPLKLGWAKAVHQWRMNSNGEKLTKYNFAPMLKTVLIETAKAETLKNAFRICGLCPFNQNAVDYSKADVYNKQIPHTNSEESSRVSPNTHNCLTFVESFINPSTLASFNEVYDKITPVWEDDTAHDLFVAWKKAKDFLLSNVNSNNCSMVQAETTKHPDVHSAPSANASLSRPLTILTDECIDHLDVQETIRVSPENTGVIQYDVDMQCTSGVVDTSNLPSTSKGNISERNPRPKLREEATRKKLSKILSPGTQGENVPSPLKDYLPWPGTPTKTKKKLDQRTKNKIPPVISGKDWQIIEKKRIEGKKLEEQKKLERKRLREAKSIEKNSNKKRKDLKKNYLTRKTGFVKFAKENIARIFFLNVGDGLNVTVVRAPTIINVCQKNIWMLLVLRKKITMMMRWPSFATYALRRSIVQSDSDESN